MTASVERAMREARSNGSSAVQRSVRPLRGKRARSMAARVVDGIARCRDRRLFHAIARRTRGTIRLGPIVAALALASACAASAFAGPTCRELAYDSPQHHAKMDELAARATLNDGAWNRYHESLVSALCAGKRDRVDRLVDQGFVTAAETERIAAVLDKKYTPKKRSATGNRYAAAKSRFVELGACSACADNIAQYYTRKPASRCGTLAQKALGGDAAAVEQLVAFPDWCRWDYGSATPSAHSSSPQN